MDDLIGKWRQAGTTHLWRYKPEKKGLEGWHFQPDEEALNSIIFLVEILTAATYPAKRTLTLTKPSGRIVNGPFAPIGDRKIVAPASLQISVDVDDAKDRWELNDEGERLKLRLGPASVTELLEGLKLLRKRGYGDFSVGPWRSGRHQNIWFW